MTRYLLTTLLSDDLGLLTRSLPIGRELRDRGHQVAFCNAEKAPSRLIEEAGFKNLPLATLPWELLTKGFQKESTSECWDLDHFLYPFMWNETFNRAEVNAYSELIEMYQPDAIVDFWNPHACIAARINHKRLITVVQSNIHPDSQGFIWWKEKPIGLPSALPAIKSMLAEYHLPPIQKIAELLIGDLTLVLGIPETDPLPETARVTYIGAQLWQRREQKLPDWIEALPKNQPVVWIYPGNPSYSTEGGTPFDSKVVIQACIEALGGESMQVVVTTGYQSIPEDCLPLPGNFHHEAFIPGLAMAVRSNLLIHHGGYGSCQTGLYAGVPALILPTYSERESNARRVAAVGAGDFIVPTEDKASGFAKHLSPALVLEKVNRILSDLSFSENARRISQKLHSFGGATYAANLIERAVAEE